MSLIVNIYRCGGSGTITIYQNDSIVGTLSTSQSVINISFNVGDNIKLVVDKANSGWEWQKICHTGGYEELYVCDSLIIIDDIKTTAHTTVTSDIENICLYTQPVHTSIPITVNIWRGTYNVGSVEIYKNEQLIDTLKQTDTEKHIQFNIGDTYTLQANPTTGWIFDKWCHAAAYQQETCDTLISGNPATGIVTSEIENVWVYYQEKVDTCKIPQCNLILT